MCLQPGGHTSPELAQFETRGFTGSRTTGSAICHTHTDRKSCQATSYHNKLGTEHRRRLNNTNQSDTSTSSESIRAQKFL
eukprot:4426797-Amphidinium_carterae.1